MVDFLLRALVPVDAGKFREGGSVPLQKWWEASTGGCWTIVDI